MKCIFCDSDTKVTNKRDVRGLTRRRRECLRCKKRFTTLEQPEFKRVLVIKKDNSRVPFDIEKVRNGVIKACEKRPISIDKIEKTVSSIEAKLREGNKKEIKSKTIGEMIMKALKKLDKVAYIRFASVYREFSDIGDFKKEIRGLK
jgi:transcriptional repressor NrdR